MRMRSSLVVLHRWAGLVMAGFLVLTGLTGAIISWDHELDEWLNPHLHEARTTGRLLDPMDLVAGIEARHPEVQVTMLPLRVEAGASYAFWVEPRVDASSGRLSRPGYNQIFIDSVSGEELGRREWGAVWPLNRENAVSFLYKLHFSLHLPEFLGSDRWGIWLLGGIALIWTLDCFTGVVLTFPSRRRPFFEGWRKAWKVRWRAGAYKLNFDLHRAGSLWTWGLLFVVAFTGFSLNLYREVFFPAMSLVSTVTPSPFDLREPTPPTQPIPAGIDFARAVALASAEATRRGWSEPAAYVFHARQFGIYGVEFYHPDDEHGVGGVGPRHLYFDAGDGRYLGDRRPWEGSAADLFVQAQFPLHSGRILGLAGRILISAMGVVVAMLAVTGVYVWWRKHRARCLGAARAVQKKPDPDQGNDVGEAAH